MFIIRYITDRGTRQSEPVTTIESARYLRAEILAKQKPHETEIVDLSGNAYATPSNDLLSSLLDEED